MRNLYWKNIIWIIIEILISISIYYLNQWVLKNTEFPFTDNMISGVFILLLTLGVLYGISIFAFIKVDELITGTKLNKKKGIIFLICGAIFSLTGMNLLKELKVIQTDFPLFMFVLIIITIPIISLNYGLRIK